MRVGLQRQKPNGRRQASAAGCAISVIMPTHSWQGPFEACARRVLELVERSSIPAEFIVVHDGPMTKPPEWLRRSGASVFGTRSVRGPAAARNKAAEQALGTVLFFVDSDVELAADALERVHASFVTDDGPVAVFGAYDNAPASPGVVSQFRNLLHHHTHVSHPGRAGTFWAGCGAVRAAQFHDLGGFDEKYECPSVEDIELGNRIATHGGRIVLDPLLQGKHHKVWTLRSMVVTDISSRAIPWTKLIVNTGRLPATLNVDWKNRISGVMTVASVAAAAWAAWTGTGLPVAIGCAAGVVALNLDFYLLCIRRHGLAFGAAGVALHFLFFLYSSIAFGAVVVSALVFGKRRSPCTSPSSPGSPGIPVPTESRPAASTAVSPTA